MIAPILNSRSIDLLRHDVACYCRSGSKGIRTLRSFASADFTRQWLFSDYVMIGPWRTLLLMVLHCLELVTRVIIPLLFLLGMNLVLQNPLFAVFHCIWLAPYRLLLLQFLIHICLAHRQFLLSQFLHCMSLKPCDILPLVFIHCLRHAPCRVLFLLFFYIECDLHLVFLLLLLLHFLWVTHCGIFPLLFLLYIWFAPCEFLT